MVGQEGFSSILDEREGHGDANGGKPRRCDRAECISMGRDVARHEGAGGLSIRSDWTLPGNFSKVPLRTNVSDLKELDSLLCYPAARAGHSRDCDDLEIMRELTSLRRSSKCYSTALSTRKPCTWLVRRSVSALVLGEETINKTSLTTDCHADLTEQQTSSDEFCGRVRDSPLCLFSVKPERCIVLLPLGRE